MSKRPLTTAELKAADLIKAAVEANPSSQEAIAMEVGVTQGALWQWMNGKVPVSPKRAVRLANALGVDDPATISPSWAAASQGQRPLDRGLRAIDMVREDEAGYWLIPRYDVFMALGEGEQPQWEGGEPDQLPGNAFREEFCREMGWHPSTHFSARVEGVSMIEAHLLPGWSIVVDATPEAKQTIMEDEIYALRENGSGLICKFLEPMHDGGLRIISANSSHPRFREPRVLSPEEAEHIELLGRVVHVQGMLGRRR